jgi:dTDP-4-dehydrorhamnose reductase
VDDLRDRVVGIAVARLKLLVTGAAGYLGSEVTARAEAQGHDVVSLWLNRRPECGRPARADLRDEEDTARVFLEHRPNAVIHTAYRQADDVVWDAVVRATHNVALASARVGARLVHLSTDLVFDGEREGRYGEDDEPRPISLYGDAKLAAEKLVAELDPGAVLVRTSLLYGKPAPGPQELLARRDDVTFFTDEIRCPTLVGELADALLELAERDDVSGALHVAGADAVSRHRFAELLAPGRDVRASTSPPGARARNVALDCSRARELLGTRLRGVEEILRSL